MTHHNEGFDCQIKALANLKKKFSIRLAQMERLFLVHPVYKYTHIKKRKIARHNGNQYLSIQALGNLCMTPKKEYLQLFKKIFLMIMRHTQ